MRTLHEPKNQAFSDAAHEAAKEIIYPYWFEHQGVSFERTKVEHGGMHRVFDGEMAIDVIVRMNIPGFNYPFEYTVQERFRRMPYAKYEDVTITEWNSASNMPSELYKIKANYILYGYFDDSCGLFHSWYLITTTSLLDDVRRGKVRVRREINKKGQHFIAIPIEDLMKTTAVNIYQPPA